MKKLNETQRKLVELHLGIAKTHAAEYVKKFHSGILDYEDLYHYAVLGLCSAALKWDESKNIKFVTFAWTFSKGRILQAIRDKSQGVKPPRRLIEEYKKQVVALYENNTSLEDIANELDITVEEINIILNAHRTTIPIEEISYKLVAEYEETLLEQVSPEVKAKIIQLSDSEINLCLAHLEGNPSKKAESIINDIKSHLTASQTDGQNDVGN